MNKDIDQSIQVVFNTGIDIHKNTTYLQKLILTLSELKEYDDILLALLPIINLSNEIVGLHNKLLENIEQVQIDLNLVSSTMSGRSKELIQNLISFLRKN